MDTWQWATVLLGVLGGLGIGSAITAVVQSRLKLTLAYRESQRQDLERRYRVIILLMYAAHDFSGSETTLRINRPDLTDRDMVLSELQAEWVNMLLFALRSTLESLRVFIADPSFSHLVSCATSMRRDLGRDAFTQWDVEQLSNLQGI